MRMRQERNRGYRFGTLLCMIPYAIATILGAFPPTHIEGSGAFADHLFEQGDYVRALGEYKRLAFFATEPESALYFQFKIGESYRFLREYDRAKEQFDRILLTGRAEKELEYRVTMSSAICLINRDDTPYARIILQDLKGSGYQHDSLSYLMGVSYLKDLRLEEAEGEFSSIQTRNLKEAAVELLDDVSSRKLKSPRTALLLSAIVPGAGQFYASRPLKGIISFSLNLSLGYLTYKAYSEDRKLDSFLIVYFGLQRFYFGNLHQARQYATEYNQDIRKSIKVE